MNKQYYNLNIFIYTLNSNNIMLSIIVPCFNEEKIIYNNLIKIYQFMIKQKVNFEIILINDGSKDKTELEIKKAINYLNSKRIKAFNLKKNQGKGYAVKEGVKKSSGDYVLFMDADLATDLKEITNFIKIKDKFDIIIGNRISKKAKREIFRKLSGKISYLITQLVLGLDIKDTQCGFKLFNKKSLIIFKEQKINRWGFDFELLYLARKKGFKIKEVLVKWKEMPDSKVKVIDYIKTFKELRMVKKIHK